MSLFVNQYMTRAKKFELECKRVERGISLEIKTFESLKLEMTDDQAAQIVAALTAALGNHSAPAPRAPKPAYRPPSAPAQDEDYD